LRRVDLPTFGLPTMGTKPDLNPKTYLLRWADLASHSTRMGLAIKMEE